MADAVKQKPFYIDVAENKKDNTITSWCRDHDGKIFRETVPAGDYTYYFTLANDGKYHPFKNLHGQMMKRVDCDNYWKMREDTEHDPHVAESDISPKIRYMIDGFAEADIESPYNVAYYDIEVDFDLEAGTGYPVPTDPFGEINSIQLFDDARKCYVMIMPDHLRGRVTLTDPEYPIEIFYTKNEAELLVTFADVIEDIDILGGWFTDGFDLPYIMERARINFGVERAARLLCRDGYPATRRDFTNENGVDVWEWTLVGRQHVDMMKLFKKFVPSERDSFSLNAVCEDEGVGRKIPYTGDLGELYRVDPQKFYEYALHDARLLKDLDAKKKIMQLAMTMSREACVTASDVAGTVKPIEHAFIKFCKTKGIVLPNKKQHRKEKFAGAIVYESLEGLFKWIASFDITSLYPSVMIMLGLSPETIVMQCVGEYGDYVQIVNRTQKIVQVVLESSGEVLSLPASDISDIIRESGFTVSANGTIFNGELGLLSEFVQMIFNKRVTQKGLSKQYAKEGDTLNAQRYDLFQQVTKIFANSLYGCIGNQHFRLFDLRLAKSITLSGQVVSKIQMTNVNELIESIA